MALNHRRAQPMLPMTTCLQGGVAAHAALLHWGVGAMLAACVCAAHAAPPLAEVTITARGDALNEQRAALGQKTVLDRQEIASLGGLSVGEVIRKLPGVEAADQGDGGLSARARGMSSDAVQFLVNGERPTANARFALTQISRLPAGELERIEILRGASAEFGGAAAITVNLVMRRPPGAAETTLKAALGQRGDEPNAQFSLSRSGGSEDFSWLLPLTINRHGMPLAQDWQRAGTLPAQGEQQEQERGHYSIDEFILSPRLAWKSHGDQLTLWPSYYRNEGQRESERWRQDVGDPAADALRFEREDSCIRILRLRLEGERRLWGGKLSGRAAVMDGLRTHERQRQSLQGSLPEWQESARREDKELSASLRHDRAHGAGDSHFVSLGVDVARYRRDDTQQFSGAFSGTDDFSGREQQWSLWLQDEWRLQEDLALTLGVRGQRMRLQLPAAQRRHGSLDPSLAVRWQLAPSWVARASVGSSIRFPKLEELSSVSSISASANSPLEADRGGNPALRPERIRNFEAGIEYSLAREAGVLGANAYARQTRDFIERRQVLAGARWVERPENAGRAQHWGLELSAKLRGGLLPASASLRASLTLPHGKVDDSRLGLRRMVRDMPSHTASLGYEQNISRWQSTVGMQLQRSGTTRSQVVAELNSRTATRDLLDVHVVRRLNEQFNLRLGVQNLLRADAERVVLATDGSNQWSLASRELGQRTWLLALEGKW